MIKENVQSFLDHGVLLKELKRSFVEFECFKLGIIDEQGNKIKTPVTEQEKMSFSPMVRTVLKLKRYLGSKIDLIEACGDFEHKVLNINENIEHYKKVIEYQDKIRLLVNELYKTLDEAYLDGLLMEDISKILKA